MSGDQSTFANQPHAAAAPQPAPRQRATAIAVVALLILHIALAYSAAVRYCTTCDEIAHLTAGYAKWKTGDFRIVPEHPPLAHLWAALPLLFMDVKFPSLDQPSWWIADQWRFGAAWFYEIGNDPQRLLAAGRFMIALLSAALGLIVFLWSRRIWGNAGGLVSLVLFCFCPTLLANGALVTTDTVAGLFFLLATMTVWTALHRVSPWTILASGLALGGLFLAKMSAPLIAPVYGIMLLVRLISAAPLPVRMGSPREVRGIAARLGVHAAVALVQLVMIWACIWAGHGLRFQAMREAMVGRDRLPVPEGLLPEGVQCWDHILERRGRLGEAVDTARHWRILPEAYLYGFAFAMDMTRGSDAFLNGERSAYGFTAFFPYCFLVKSTLPCLVLLAAAVPLAALAGRRRAEQAEGLGGHALAYSLTPILVLMGVYVWSALASSFNIGHRHLLPVYPPLFILCGALATASWWRSTAWRGVVVALLVLHAAASTSVWPRYLAFFNVIAGGPAGGYRHLVDSSLDWGQDLPGLKRWLDENARGEPVYLSYMGNGSPEHTGIEYEVLPTFPPKKRSAPLRPYRGGVYCISATNLQAVRILPSSRWTVELERLYQQSMWRIREIQGRASSDAGPPPAQPVPDEVVSRLRFARLCAYLRRRKTDAEIGHSIFVYRLSQADLDAALFSPPPETAPDDAEGLYRLGDLFAEVNAPALAEPLYALALSLKPDDPRVRHNRGVVLGQMGRIDESIKELREAVRLKPDFAEAYENLGNALAVGGQLLEASPNYERAIALRPRKPEPYASLADVYALRDDLKNAAAAYVKVIGLRPNWPEAHASLASVYARAGRLDAALVEYREAARLRPGSAVIQNDLGTVLAEAGQLDEAIEAFSHAARLDPGSAVFHFNLANALLRRLRCAESIPHFNETLRLDPSMEDARKGLEKALEIMQSPASQPEDFPP